MAYREFADEAGRAWRAWDSTPSGTTYVPPEYARGWVSFESDSEKRRLAPPPPDWDTCPDERLRRMLQDAVPVPFEDREG